LLSDDIGALELLYSPASARLFAPLPDRRAAPASSRGQN